MPHKPTEEAQHVVRTEETKDSVTSEQETNNKEELEEGFHPVERIVDERRRPTKAWKVLWQERDERGANQYGWVSHCKFQICSMDFG